jgi:BirA family transcriptional regulator, biotin operon repressor / biotin---[acetyl-CoA-carboxylase] ligase
MISLDAELIRQLANDPVRERLAHIKVFARIDSTNSYLMQMPAPEPGRLSVAVTNNQTAGRGRLGKTWQSPPGSGLCLSAAYTFAEQPENLPALTLALGLGVIDALHELGAGDVELKWPNDLVALDGKLGGILTEVQQQSAGTATVVTGIGVNVDLKDPANIDMLNGWAQQAVDLQSICDVQPGHEEIAAQFISYLLQAFVDFETSGFAAIADRWSRYDWLLGRDIMIDTADKQVSGVGAGIADDGALLVDTPDSGLRRVTSGSIAKAGPRSAGK